MTNVNPIELVGQLPLEQLQPLDNVSMWLNECGLSEYIQTFKTAGYDDINLIKILNDEDLDAMGIDKPGTRKKILFYAEQLRQITDPHGELFMEPIEPEPQSSPSPAAASPRPKKGNSRANPYRCTKCCEFKIRSLDGKAHQCNPDLIGHTWEQCPTQNLRQHPEERQRRKQNQKLNKGKSRKRKGTSSKDSSPSPCPSADHSPDLMDSLSSCEPEYVTPWNAIHYGGENAIYAAELVGEDKLFVFDDDQVHKRLKTSGSADISQQVADVSVAVMENYMSDELARQLGSHAFDSDRSLTQEELRHHHIDFD